MPTWPVSLPQEPLRAGFNVAPRVNIISFGTEVGPGKLRRRSTARIKNMPFNMLLDDTRLATFVAFFEDDLEDGALAFDLPDPIGGATGSFRVAPADPPYTVNEAGRGSWLVSMLIQKLP